MLAINITYYFCQSRFMHKCLHGQKRSILLHWQNAIKYYSPQGGNVNFALAMRTGNIFCIRDQGIGIPSEDQQQMFEPSIGEKCQ